MKHFLSRTETALLTACVALLVLAWLGPPVAQPAHYHHFADQRAWLGIPCALDVLSNLPFALGGWLGLAALRRLPAGAVSRPERHMATLFFTGLLLTAAASGHYHWQPDDAGLAVDRMGMALAFAGLLGLAAGRVSARAAHGLGGALLVLAPMSVAVWVGSGNLLPWVVLQFGGMALVLWLLVVSPAQGALAVRWWCVLAIYALAKLLELADAPVFVATGGLLSGHTLKHLVASLAAWPVLAALWAASGGATDTRSLRHHDRMAPTGRTPCP